MRGTRTVGWVKRSATQNGWHRPQMLGRARGLDPTYVAARVFSRRVFSVIVMAALVAPIASSVRAAGAEPAVASGWAATVKPKEISEGPQRPARAPKAAAKSTPANSTPVVQTPATATVVPVPPPDAEPPVHGTPERREPASVELKVTDVVAPATPSTPEAAAAVQQFCASIGPSAIEARTAWLQKTTAELEQQLETRVAALEAKIAEHKEWLGKRQEFARKAGDGLVQVFTKLKPEAAAQQIAAMDEPLAAALLVRLDAKVASALLNEVPPAKAARLTSMFATVAGIGAKRRDSTGADAGPVK
jgi:flagellar motility protein MotE (MotC chaperone)